MSAIRTVRQSLPIVAVWLALSSVLSLLLFLGKMPNADVDDLLKLHEIRHLLTTGDPFDRTLTGIAQPELLTSHWPWIVDAPYALMAAATAPFLGMEAAVSAAAFIVPLFFLLIAVTLLFLVIGEFEFEHPGVVLAVAALAGLPSFSEFQPWRIDYHNLQMCILLAVTLLTMRGGELAAGLTGALTALSAAISAEMVPFLALPVGFYAFAFIARKEGAEKNLRTYGLSLAAAGVAAFFLVVGPQVYTSVTCDRYSLLHLAALVTTGIVLAIATVVTGSRWARAACLLACACAIAVLLISFFPQCLGGPLAGLNGCVRENWLLRIEQERSIFHSSDFLSSDRFARFSLAILGCSATFILAIADMERRRAWIVLALFSTLGLLLGLIYLRYLRYFPLFIGPGLVLLAYQAIPARLTIRRYFGTVLGDEPPGVLRLAIPAIAFVVTLFAGHLVWPPQKAELIGVDIANACEKDARNWNFIWPEGARLFAPPEIGGLMLDLQAKFDVVAIPSHTSAQGIERVQRFFDPATSAPAQLLDSTKATHVVVCRADENTFQATSSQFPLASQLASGKPPYWLTECPQMGPLRIYRYTAAGGPSGKCPIDGAAAK